MTEGGFEADPAHAERDARRRGRRKAILHAAFAAVGLLAVALLVRSVGPGALLSIVRASARWIPLLIGLEALRIGLEVATTCALSPKARRGVRLGELTRIHVVGYAIAAVMPAGRAACEAVKAAMLSRSIGVPAAAAVGAGNQAMAILGGAVATVACLGASIGRTGLSPLSFALLVMALASASLFTVFQIACRRRAVGGLLVRRFARLQQSTSAFQDEIRAIPILPAAAVLAALLGRVLQAGEFGVLLHGIGAHADVGAALVCQGVSIIGGSLGELMPGQLGATDGAFALAAPTLGISLADGVAISVLMHCVQLFWGALGATVPLWWRSRLPPR